MGLKEIADALKKYDNYLITSHINVEGDAIGSELAVFYLIKQLGKRVVIVNNDPVPERYQFLPGSNKIMAVNEKMPAGYENIIVVDCPTVERSGKLAQTILKSKIKINIDHHVSNNNFADFNWVEPEASSCGEMIFRLYREMGLNINEDIATALYVAILTDSGSFRYDSTTYETHLIAGELIKLGVKPDKMAAKVYESKALGDIELLAKVLSTIKLSDDGKIAYMYVTKKMLQDTSTVPDRTDGFINFARSIEGCEISIFFREDVENLSLVHVGFRSRGMANVNVLAGKFGGGGHPKASGCMVKGPLDKAIAQILKTAHEFLL